MGVMEEAMEKLPNEINIHCPRLGCVMHAGTVPTTSMTLIESDDSRVHWSGNCVTCGNNYELILWKEIQ